ncbi:MAG: helix-turn-helix domain-containing protein [Planctomycetes bacterium]|nr:helix-turn-helix domain-containing protein [Planctomycetota bacterium]
MANAQKTIKPPSLLLSAKSLARELDVSERTIRKLNSAGKIPKPLKLQGSVRWSYDELRAWIAAGSPARDVWENMN